MYSQEAAIDLSQIDLETVDFSQARLSVAGPGSFLIRGVRIESEAYSVIFKEQSGNWVVQELIPEGGNPVLPSNVILDFATVSITENGLKIDGIIIDGKAYSTTLTLSENSLQAPAGLSAAKLVGGSLNRISDDAGLFTNDDVNAQTARMASLQERNTSLVAQVGDISEELDIVRQENEELTAQIAQLREEKAVLTQEVADLQNRVGGLSSALSEAENELSVALSSIAELEASQGEVELPATQEPEEQPEENTNTQAATANNSPVFDLLLARIDVLLEKIALLEGNIVELEEDLADASAAASSRSPSVSAEAGTSDAQAIQRIRELEQQVAQLRVENSRLSAERNEIEQEVRRELLEEGYIAAMLPSLSAVRQRGFSMGETQIGRWNLNESGVMAQTDPNQFFAKLDLPLPQDERPTLYSFEGRSRGRGWVGFGVHIFADNVDKRGYGYGESLLIWFTRDPDHYGTNQTYLEIYRSSDDINMARVLSAAITEDMDEWMDVDLLYQPGDEYITVAVNGIEKVRYKTWFGLSWGVQMALRTLDLGEFRNLEVRSTEGEIAFP